MTEDRRAAARNVALYPWFRFFQNLLFWQAVWFLYFQNELSAAEAILLNALYDLATTVLEVPSGWMSDRVGRRITLILAAVFAVTASALLAFGGSFWVFLAGQVAFGASAAFSSGTDTAFLYESLEDAGRADEVEAQELRAWRFNFTALALSALIGGAVSLVSYAATFVMAGAAALVMLVIAIRFVEPGRLEHHVPQGGEWARFGALREALVNPVLLWLFALTVLMYGLSHVPFVFGQPYIQQSLASLGLEAEAPLVSGAVTTAMMLLSVAVSWAAPGIRHRIGLTAILLAAFAIQIGLAAILAATSSAFAIVFLLLRMVPNSLSAPFILARVQPELKNESRATYLSLKSLTGRIVFAASLYVATFATSAVDEMSFGELRLILLAYAGAGLIALVALWFWARRLPLDQPARANAA